MTSRQRTQVYLDHDEHLRLRRLAAERGLPMTEIVREAVARYLTQERGAGVGGDDGDGVPAGPAGLGARMRARLAASDDSTSVAAPPMSDEDRDVARALEHKLGGNP